MQFATIFAEFICILRDLSRRLIELVRTPNLFGSLTCSRRMFRAAGTRMPWHPVPFRAASVYLRYRLLSTCSLLISYVVYKETAFGFWILFWLHQGGIPRHTCRFYLLLAGAVGKRQGIAIPYPSPTPLLTPLGIRCGGAYRLPRAWGNIGICIPVQIAHPQVGIWCSWLCSGRYRSRFSRFRWAYVFRFSLLGGGAVRACGYGWFCNGLS